MQQTIHQRQQIMLFLRKGLIFLCWGCLAVVVFTLITSLLSYPFNKNMGRASYIDKMKRLDSISSPKIIIIGGSNANYGLNSQLLQDSVHLPVVNMSLNANVSFIFFCNVIKDHIQPGDIILALPEYQFFDPQQQVYGNQNLYQLATIVPTVAKHFTPVQWSRAPLYLDDICAANLESISYLLRNQPTETRGFYNSLGDFIGHQNKTTTLQKTPNVYVDYKSNLKHYQKINAATKKHLIAFDQFVSSKGATLLLDWPVYSNKLVDENFAGVIKNELLKLNWIGSYNDYLYDESALYDSPYHLKFDYQNNRTWKIVNDIKRWQNAR
jgi:hypothetical protein